MTKIVIMSVGIVHLAVSGCAHKDLNHTESQEYVDSLCGSGVNRTPIPDNITMEPNVSYSECIVNHG
ncbi:MAG: Uncharacterised protein [Porticoccaceae bacterium UBA1117]|jgi:hypothetical protein|nr:MAG: Uncharacterised protein [Porticoccaceae bacterium UBA1117]